MSVVKSDILLKDIRAGGILKGGIAV